MATLRDWYGRMRPTAVALVDGTGLAHLRFSLFYHLDVPLLCAFIERWQPDTSSFHLPFGEMTIMLHDVYRILRIPVTGRLVSTPGTPSDVVRDMGLLMARPIVQGDIHGGAIAVSKVTQACMREEIPDAEQARAWIWLLIGCTLFMDKSATSFHPTHLLEMREDLGLVPDYAWGTATLTFLYRELGFASRGAAAQVAGHLSLLQAWIYEFFPSFRPSIRTGEVGADEPRIMRWDDAESSQQIQRLDHYRRRLDSMTEHEV